MPGFTFTIIFYIPAAQISFILPMNNILINIHHLRENLLGASLICAFFTSLLVQKISRSTTPRINWPWPYVLLLIILCTLYYLDRKRVFVVYKRQTTSNDYGTGGFSRSRHSGNRGYSVGIVHGNAKPTSNRYRKKSDTGKNISIIRLIVKYRLSRFIL